MRRFYRRGQTVSERGVFAEIYFNLYKITIFQDSFRSCFYSSSFLEKESKRVENLPI
jgi:hypothetical protein